MSVTKPLSVVKCSWYWIERLLGKSVLLSPQGYFSIIKKEKERKERKALHICSRLKVNRKFFL